MADPAEDLHLDSELHLRLGRHRLKPLHRDLGTRITSTSGDTHDKARRRIIQERTHLDALGCATPVDGAEAALAELVALAEVAGRLQQLLERVHLPRILQYPCSCSWTPSTDSFFR